MDTWYQVYNYIPIQAGLTINVLAFPTPRDRVLSTRCERSQIFTKNILHVTVHLARPVRLTYTVYRHAHQKHSVDTHMHS